MFEIVLTPIILVLLAVLLASALYLLLFFRHYVATVTGRVATDGARKLPATASELPAVSVIVYSEDDAGNLEVLLPQILEQDYPGLFEVIVVNDGSIGATKDVIARMERRYSNLYMTFTPQESRSLSRKKLAITLGIKAAKYGIVVLTNGTCQVPSPQWLRAMTSRFGSDTKIVLGYAAPAEPEGARHPRKRLHAFDQVRTAVEWLSWAIAGRPYRGTSCNIAYKRDVFFANKGFSRSLDLKYGDDDVFVSEVARGHNCAVELSPASMLLEVSSTPASTHRIEKHRRDFTASRLRGHARIFFSSCSWAWWLMWLSGAALSLAGWPSVIPLACACVVTLATLITLMVTWRKCSLALWSRPILLTFGWFMSIHPLYTLCYMLRGRSKRDSNLTWG